MSIKLMSRIWDIGPDRQSDRFVLLALADYANDDGECWPGIAGLCRKTCLSERGVQTVIRRLEVAGWIEIHTGAGRKNCNLYVIKNPAPYAPRTICTPHMDAENPAPYAPEPLRTIIEERDTKVSPKKIGSRLSEAWVLPRDWGEWALSEGWADQAVRMEAAKFRDYWVSATGRGATKLDWQATWRNWMRNSKTPKLIGGTDGRVTKGQQRLAAFIAGARGAS